MEELEGLEWDVITINETMRCHKREVWTMHGGHVFMGSGYDLPTRGVALLVHKKWKPYIKTFYPINERIAYVDIVKKKLRIRFVAAYFPHSGYEDEYIESMYEVLGNIRSEARRKGMQFIMGADCNAQVGISQEDDDPRIIGQFGMQDVNDRGMWLKNWATAQSLTIMNTCYEKPVEKLHTFVGPSGAPRQIDFFLVSRKLRGWVRDCEAVREVDMNSDHKTLKMRISFQDMARSSTNRQRGKKQLPAKWPPPSVDEYKQHLTKRLDDLMLLDQSTLECKQIEGAMVEVMAAWGQENVEGQHTTSSVLEELIRRRRSLPQADQKGRSECTKLIRKEVRAIKRETRRSKIGIILHEYRNLKHISGIKTRKQQELIPSMLTKDGQEVHERQSIADVFASFYGELYGDEQRKDMETECSVADRIVDFSLDELKVALKSLKSGKSADENRICAEMLKYGGEKLCMVMLEQFNRIIKPSSSIPKDWSKTIIKVLHKSGDVRLPQNYRPIATIPLLYKLFSRMVYNRLEPVLDAQQNKDQSGFRRNRTTVDHLFTTALIQETAEEWKYPLWVAAVDFKKAFDSVTHRALWQALKDQGVSQGYINLLDKLYHKQTGMVKTEKMSKLFNIERGVKQGDPLSSLLFNSVSEHVMRPLKERWESKYGIRMGTDKDVLTNLRFADDILLVSHSLPSMTQMIEDLSRQAGMVGLSLHPEKTKILRNKWASKRGVPSYVMADGMRIEVMDPDGHTKYLGRKLTFHDSNRSEIENRIAIAWRKFHAQKQELTGKTYSLNDRLRLFNGTVTPTILYGSETWTMTKEIEQRIRATQRQMLRMIVRIPRRVMEPSAESAASDVTSEEADENIDISIETEVELEPWSEWIQRATHEAENRMKRLNFEDWISLQRRRKWKWAQKVATSTGDSWILDAVTWDPYPRLSTAASRRVGRPTKRWTDDLREYVYRAVYDDGNHPSMNPRFDNVEWLCHARDATTWAQLEQGYLQR